MSKAQITLFVASNDITSYTLSHAQTAKYGLALLLMDAGLMHANEVRNVTVRLLVVLLTKHGVKPLFAGTPSYWSVFKPS